MSEYENPQPLVEISWLADHLRGSSQRIVDTRCSTRQRARRDARGAGHILRATICLRPLGYDNVSLYDDSCDEWSRRSDQRAATGDK
jgi:3-mercaptopyruvate sulfurtransferase SseA